MTATCRTSAFALALLLAAATAVADVVITADEVIRCWEVEPVGDDSVRFTLPKLKLRTLPTLDIYEVRLADAGRVAALSSRLPQLKVVMDSGQPIPAPAARALRMDSIWGAGPLHATPQNATPGEMLAKCREMKAVLRECGKNTDTIVDLLRDVEREEQALRRIRRSAAARCSPWARGCVQSAITGNEIGSDAADWSAQGNSLDTGRACCWAIGCCLGSAAISSLPAIIGAVTRHQTIVVYRERVNVLVRRVNRAIARP